MEKRGFDHIRFVTRHFNDLQGLRYWVPLGLITLSLGGHTYFSSGPMLLLRALLFSGALLLAIAARRYYQRAFGEVEASPLFAVPVAEPESLSVFSPTGSAPLLSGMRTGSPVARRFVVGLGLTLALYLILRAASPPVSFTVDESLVQAPWEIVRSGTVTFVSPPSAAPVTLSQSDLKALFGQILCCLYGSFLAGIWLWRGRRLSQSHHVALGGALLAISALGASKGLYYPSALLGPPSVVTYVVQGVQQLWILLLLCGGSMILAGLLDHWQLVRAFGRPAARLEEARR